MQDRGALGGIQTVAKRTVVTLFVLGILGTVTLGLAFLVYRGRISPGPFLLLVGIVVGFLLGRLDAAL